MNPHVVAEGIPQLFNYDSPDRPRQEIIPVQQHQLPTQQTQSHSEIQARHFQHVLGSDDRRLLRPGSILALISRPERG
jgi:hypothetical protein